MELQRKKVLIVDNDEDVLINLERALEEHDCETVTAWDLPEALETLEGSGFDLLLIGDHPPELNCERLLKQLNRANVTVPVVVMHSAERYPFSEGYLRYLGAMGVACKWNEGAVVQQVENCLTALPIAAAVRSMAKRAASH
ncbi:MAG: response regulator [Terriglobales bacterium]